MSVQNSVVKLMVLSQLVNETIDEVKGTQYYVREVKQAVNRLEDSIKKNYESTIDMLYATDDMAMIGLGRIGERIIDPLVDKDIYTLAHLAEAMKDLEVKKCSPCTVGSLAPY
jgi:hypothetical protein